MKRTERYEIVKEIGYTGCKGGQGRVVCEY
jgi:hypothetical protein